MVFITLLFVFWTLLIVSVRTRDAIEGWTDLLIDAIWAAIGTLVFYYYFL